MSAVDVPRLDVVRGVPTPDELAALVVLLAGAGAEPAAVDGPGRSTWVDGGRVRTTLPSGPGAWRASGLPR